MYVYSPATFRTRGVAWHLWLHVDETTKKIPLACTCICFLYQRPKKFFLNTPTYVLTRPHCMHVKLVLLVLLNLFKSEIRSIFLKNDAKQYHHIFFWHKPTVHALGLAAWLLLVLNFILFFYWYGTVIAEPCILMLLALKSLNTGRAHFTSPLFGSVNSWGRKNYHL